MMEGLKRIIYEDRFKEWINDAGDEKKGI